MSASDVRKAIGEELFDKLAMEIFSTERPKEFHLQTLAGKGGLPVEAVEALIRHAENSPDMAEKAMDQGKTLFFLGLILIFGGLGVNWVTVKIGFVVRILVVVPLIGLGAVAMGVQHFLMAVSPLFRKPWMHQLQLWLFILSLVLGLVGFFYYLLFL